MKRPCKHALSLLLALLLLFSCLPVHALAEKTDASANMTEASVTPSLPGTVTSFSESYDDAVIGAVAEVVSLRDKYTKHFRLSNGTYQAVQFANAIHRMDSDGVWQDIDNTLTLKSTASSATYATADSRVRFAEKYSANTTVLTLSENGYTITMSLMEDSRTSDKLTTAPTEISPTITNAEKRTDDILFDTLEDACRIDTRSVVRYDGIRANTSLEYVLIGDTVKENIIISARDTSYDYVFQLGLDGLTAESDATGNIHLKDSETEESIYTIPAPYMYDSAGAYSRAVSYDLRELSSGRYLLLVSADDGWINASERAFPVTVDPSINITNVFADSYAWSAVSDFCFGSEPYLRVFSDSTVYIRILLPDFPTGAQINQATLHTYWINPSTTNYYTAEYEVRRVTEPWIESTMTYHTAPAIDTTVLSSGVCYLSVDNTETNPRPSSDLITAAAQMWLADENTNYGVAINARGTGHPAYYIKSKEADGHHPYLSINYTCILPDGVYALENSVLQTHWMYIENDSVTPGARLIAPSGDDPINTLNFERSGLFKIARRTDGKYVIRSMLNNYLILSVSGNNLVTKESTVSDANVPLADTFAIEWQVNGYTIRPSNSSKYVGMASLGATVPTLINTEGGANARWDVLMYTGQHRKGTTIDSPAGNLIAGESGNFVLQNFWSTYPDFNLPRLMLLPEHGIYATSVWNPGTKTATVAFHDDGTFRMDLNVYNHAETSCQILNTTTYTIQLPFEEGIYFIRNKETEKYMQIDNDDEPNYNTNGSIMELWDFDVGDYQRWNVIHDSDGYYKILSVKSGLALSVEIESTDDDEEALIQEVYADLNRQKWKISTSASGALILRPKSGVELSDDWCMCAGDQFMNITDGLNVEQNIYNNDDNYKDEWCFMNLLTDSFHSTFIAIPDENHTPHDISFDSVHASLRDIGYNTNRRFTSVTAAQCLSFLSTSEIFYSRSHGTVSSIQLNDEHLTISLINSLEENALSNCKLVLYGACNTGQGGVGANNLVNATHAKGATTVIGFKSIIYCNEMNMWAIAFFEAIAEGENIDDACSAANREVMSAYGTDAATKSPHIAGSKTQTLS